MNRPKNFSLNYKNTAAEVGLHLNAKKTEMMIFNQIGEDGVYTNTRAQIKTVTDFKYLRSYVNSSANDIKIRKALAWSACHNMQKVWKSKLTGKVKLRLFKATVKSIGKGSFTISPYFEF